MYIKFFCSLVLLITLIQCSSAQTFPELPAETANTAIMLVEQERRYEKEIQEYLQKNILDKVLGEGKSSVIVDVQLGLESERRVSQARERTAERKRRLGEIEYILPGIPKPAAASQEPSEGDTKVESGETQAASVSTKLVIKRQFVTVLHDFDILQEKIDIVREAIIDALKIVKGRDELVFKKTKFASGLWTGLLRSILRPLYILILIIALLLLAFLYGPVASFLRNYIRTLRERGGTEISVDSKLAGAPGAEGAGLGGAGGGGGTIEEEEAEEEKEGEEKYLPFSYIDEENLRRLIYLISKEPPSIIALVISYLKPEFVREVLISLPEALQAEVALNLATARQMTQEEVLRIDNEIKQKIDFLVGGIDQLLKVLTEVDRETRDNILRYLNNENPELFKKIRAYLFLFEDVVSIPDQAMQIIIRELKIENIARALRNAPQEIINKFFSNMSTGAVSLVKEEMEFGRQLTNTEIEEEREKIIETIKKLEQEGRIFIREKPKLVIEGIEKTSAEIPPSAVEDYFSYATMLYNEGRYEESIPYFEYCLQISPNYYPALQYLGNAYYALGQYSHALENFEKALSYNPEDENLRQFVEQFKATLVAAER